MQLNRLFGLAAVFASGVCAGTMESSRGREIATPMPRKNVRRGRYFFEIKVMMYVSY